MSSTSRPIDDPRVYLAAERTFLAWIRTSVSLMGFGFVIARFALWTREYELLGKTATLWPGPVSRPGSGLAWFVLASFVSVLAAVRHRAYIRDLERGVANPPLHVRTSLIVAGISGVGRSGHRHPHPHALIARQPCSSA